MHSNSENQPDILAKKQFQSLSKTGFCLKIRVQGAHYQITIEHFHIITIDIGSGV